MWLSNNMTHSLNSLNDGNFHLTYLFQLFARYHCILFFYGSTLQYIFILYLFNKPCCFLFPC